MSQSALDPVCQIKPLMTGLPAWATFNTVLSVLWAFTCICFIEEMGSSLQSLGIAGVLLAAVVALGPLCTSSFNSIGRSVRAMFRRRCRGRQFESVVIPTQSHPRLTVQGPRDKLLPFLERVVASDGSYILRRQLDPGMAWAIVFAIIVFMVFDVSEVLPSIYVCVGMWVLLCCALTWEYYRPELLICSYGVLIVITKSVCKSYNLENCCLRIHCDEVLHIEGSGFAGVDISFDAFRARNEWAVALLRAAMNDTELDTLRAKLAALTTFPDGKS